MDAVQLDLPIAIESELFAIAREALNNIEKHARATEATLQLTRRGRTIALKIADNGVGITRSNGGSGHGIVGMRERARLAGGTLRIAGSRGGGTTVVVTLSVPRPRS